MTEIGSVTRSQEYVGSVTAIIYQNQFMCTHVAKV